MKRLALAGISHETNTFVPTPTGLQDFVDAGVLRGAQIVGDHQHAHTAVAGMLALSEPDIELVPLIYSAATPSGMVSDDAYELLVGEMLDALLAAGPWDGVLLALHGALVTGSHRDGDGELLRRVRALVGPAVPIGCTLDMHANVSPAMAANADAIVGYRTNPHVDPLARGLECARIVAAAATGRCRPETALAMVPAVISILRQGTDDEPMRSLMALVDRLLAEPNVLSISVFEGYPYADVAEMGMSAVVVADGDEALASRVAHLLATEIWSAREAFTGRARTVQEALDAVDEAAAHPVVLLDVGDNVGAGGTGDSTVLLRAAMDRRIPVVVTLHDPLAVGDCLRAGVGAAVSLRVGGHAPGSPESAVILDGTVKTLSDGAFEEPGFTHGGLRYFNAGRTAVVSTSTGQLVVCTEQRVLPTSLRQLTSVGIDPREHRALVAKGVFSPVAAYQPIAAELVFVDTPGLTTADLASLEYRHRRRPLYPFDGQSDLEGVGA